MRWPIASGIVTTVLNAGAATAGSSHVAGVAVNPTGEVEMDTASVTGAYYRDGMALKGSGVVFVATSGGTHYRGGLLLDDDGALIVEEGGTPALWVGGIPLNSSGAVCVSAIT